MHYMISVRWLHLLDRLGHYIIQTGAIEQVLVMARNLMTFGYTTDKFRFNTPLDIVYTLTHIGRLASLGSGTPRERTIPKSPQPLHSIHQKNQPGGPELY